MTSLSKHKSDRFTKALAIGDSKAGKTSSLISLVQAGYKLRVLDMDNLIDPLKYLILQRCPDLIDNVEVCALRDERHATEGGSVVMGVPKAFVAATKMLDRWRYQDADGEIDLGDPSEWGDDCILVIDSLSRLGDAAIDWAYFRQPKGKTGEPDGRAVVGDAQKAIEHILATITADTFEANVIVIGHLALIEQPDKSVKLFPQGPGNKLSPRIPSYFPTYVLYQNKGGRRTIHTTSTPMLDLATPAPMLIKETYDSDVGLAAIFEALKNNRSQKEPQQQTQTKPKSLRRA